MRQKIINTLNYHFPEPMRTQLINSITDNEEYNKKLYDSICRAVVKLYVENTLTLELNPENKCLIQVK